MNLQLLNVLCAITLWSLTLIGCGNRGVTPRAIDTTAEISERAEVYLEQIHQVQDSHGFIEYTHCDSLLFSSLIGVREDIEVDLRAAEKSPGEWLRRPTSYPECWAAGKSRSIISRDMILGVMFYAWINRDIKMLQDLWDFGSDNNWIMGPTPFADISAHSIMNQQYITLLARMLHKLADKDYMARHLPIIVSNSCGGFTCHLSVLYLILLGDVNGELSNTHRDLLQKIYQQNPRNLLFNAAAAKYHIPVSWNIRWDLYPVDRLPDSTDRCEEWATQRSDADPGLRPCPEYQLHSGGDLLFVEWILQR